jgi:hypothetical protein
MLRALAAIMELINVADPEKLFPEKVPEAVRSGKPFAAAHPKNVKPVGN